MLNITKPYPYQELKRKSVNGKRLYENPWGEAVPSVTTILDKTKPKEAREGLALEKTSRCRNSSKDCNRSRQRWNHYAWYPRELG